MSKKTFISSSSVRSYADTYNTFSGCDMTVVINIPVIKEGKQRTLRYVVGELQTLTYSTNMNRQAVRSISNVNAKDYVMGQRTIAGTMVFSVFDKHFSHRIINDLNKLYNTGSDILVDELPPMNINIVMANEYGSNSDIVIYGVRFINEGQVMSINDIYMENTYQYVATGLRYAKADRNPNKISNKNKIINKDKIIDNSIIKPDSPMKIEEERTNIIKGGENIDLLDVGKGNVAEIGDNISLENPWENILIYDPGKILAEKPIFEEHDESSNIKDPEKVPESIEDLPPKLEGGNKYEFVSLLVEKRRIINGRQEVLLYVIPERKSGSIYIKNPNVEKTLRRPYKGEKVLVALEPGEYYCRYIDKDSSSSVEYLEINIDNLVTGGEQNKDKEDSDQGVIDNISKDQVKVTNSQVYLKDLNGMKHYPNDEMIISNLIPDTPYKLYIKDKEIDIKTQKTNLDLYNKLEEKTKDYFYYKDKELEEVLDRIKNLTLKNNNMIVSCYKAYQEFVSLNDLKYKEIMDIIMFYATSLEQRKKQLENSEFDIPVIQNYSTNRIYVNNSAEKLVIQKLPKENNPPKIIDKDSFEVKHNKYYYQLKDPYKNLYEIYSLDAFNIKSPSIMIFSNIDEENIRHNKGEYEVDISKEIDYLKTIQCDKQIKLTPIELNIKDDKIILDLIDYINIEDAKVVLTNTEFINNDIYYSYKDITNRHIYYDLYDLGDGNKQNYAYWIIDKYNRIISKPSLFSLNETVNNSYKKKIKTDFYKKVILSNSYKRLSPLSKSIVDRTLEQSKYTEYDININFLNEMFENKLKNQSFTDDLLFFKNLFFNNKTGVKKVPIKNLIEYIEEDQILIKDNYLARLTIICPLSLSIKIVETKKIIDLKKLNNKYVIFEIYNNTKDIYSNPAIRYMPSHERWYDE